MFKVSKLFADLASYEAGHKGPSQANRPQIKGRTAFVLIVMLLLSLVAFTYCLMEIPMSRRMIDMLESVLFGIAALVGSLRFYYARKQ
jgi:hypothetical protein